MLHSTFATTFGGGRANSVPGSAEAGRPGRTPYYERVPLRGQDASGHNSMRREGSSGEACAEPARRRSTVEGRLQALCSTIDNVDIVDCMDREVTPRKSPVGRRHLECLTGRVYWYPIQPLPTYIHTSNTTTPRINPLDRYR